jgi:hypothetical protein
MAAAAEAMIRSAAVAATASLSGKTSTFVSGSASSALVMDMGAAIPVARCCLLGHYGKSCVRRCTARQVGAGLIPMALRPADSLPDARMYSARA